MPKVLGTHSLPPAIVLRARYAMSGTDMGYAATRCATLNTQVCNVKREPSSGAWPPQAATSPDQHPHTDVWLIMMVQGSGFVVHGSACFMAHGSCFTVHDHHATGLILMASARALKDSERCYY
eukprot:1933552-Rhodomonas_salina.2